MASPWFYGLDLIGTAAFAISGFIRALQRRYDLWGCFILTLLPAVGGGTIRDLLIGGMRSPPFILKDSNYLLVVFVVVIAGAKENSPRPGRAAASLVAAPPVPVVTCSRSYCSPRSSREARPSVSDAIGPSSSTTGRDWIGDRRGSEPGESVLSLS